MTGSVTSAASASGSISCTRRDAGVMANAIRALPSQRLPSEVVVPGLLDGLDNVNKLLRQKLKARRGRPRLRLAAQSA